MIFQHIGGATKNQDAAFQDLHREDYLTSSGKSAQIRALYLLRWTAVFVIRAGLFMVSGG